MRNNKKDWIDVVEFLIFFGLVALVWGMAAGAIFSDEIELIMGMIQ